MIVYLHGGPGGSQIPSYRHYQLLWEQDFTIVHWEQRGAGKSCSASLDPSTMTLAQLVSDALEVIEYVGRRFDRDDVILLGHSWGSLLGIHVLQHRPAAVAAYVGMGQISNQVDAEQRMHAFALSRADGNETAIRQLDLRGYPRPVPWIGISTWHWFAGSVYCCRACPI